MFTDELDSNSDSGSDCDAVMMKPPDPPTPKESLEFEDYLLLYASQPGK